MKATKRTLNTFDVYCMASGAMISSGIFVLPGIMLAKMQPPASVVAAYLLAGVLVYPAMLSQAELATAMPRSGGSYFFIERAMGQLAGALAGACGWLSIMLKSAFALVGMGASAKLINPDAPYWLIQIIAIASCAVLAALNAISVHHAGKLQNILVIGLLASLMLFIFKGAANCEAANYEGVFSGGWSQTIAGAAMVFISFGGLTKVASVAEEVRRPGRAIPVGMIAAAMSVWALYVLCAAILVGLDKSQPFAGSLSPLSDAAAVFSGMLGRFVLSAAAFMAFITTANSGIMSASRQPLAMARDGMLPKWLAKVSATTHTPVRAITVTAVFISAMIAATSLDTLVKAASAVMLGLFAMVNVSVIVMRKSGLRNYRPQFFSPLYPWMQIAGIIAYVAMLFMMGYAALAICGCFALLVVLWWFIALRKKGSDRQSALLYMVKQLASPVFKRADLEDELRTIAMDRDEIVHDRFDELIGKCEVLDLGGSISSVELFEKLAGSMAHQMGCDPEQMAENFLARENDSSTSIMPSLAIPHVIVPGENKFGIVLARCRDGAVLPGCEQPVRIVFAMASSEDQRNYHLKALMAVAHIASEHGFVRNWLDAPDSEHLRDLVLLSSRNRHD